MNRVISHGTQMSIFVVHLAGFHWQIPHHGTQISIFVVHLAGHYWQIPHHYIGQIAV